MDISKFIDLKNLHHAYGISSSDENLFKKISDYLNEKDNDYIFVKKYDSFYIDDAREIKKLSEEKGSINGKRFFILQTNSILAEPQNALLKTFEEPGENTHFFFIIRDLNNLLPTLQSRLLKLEINGEEEKTEKIKAEDFIKLSVSDRLDLIKKITDKKLADEDRLSKNEAIVFVNELEKYIDKNRNEFNDFEFILKEIFMVKKYLNKNGASIKMLLDHLCVVV